MRKFIGFFGALAVLALVVFGYVRFYYVFGEGVKTGTLNYVVHKGIIFKTYEGKLIQSGLRTGASGAIQSYEFEFSIEDPEIAKMLMLEGGEDVELHYKEYFGRLPWRGYTKYIVDDIIAINGRRVEPVDTSRSRGKVEAEKENANEEGAVEEQSTNTDSSVTQSI